MTYRSHFKKYKVSSAIILFIILFSIIQIFKPGFLYNPDGSLREFGLGYRNKTIFPVWLLALVLAIMSYYFVFCYLS